MEYKMRIMKRIIEPTDGRKYSGRIHVEIDHDGGPEYLKISNEDYPEREFYIEKEQWSMLRKLIDMMIKECRE